MWITLDPAFKRNLYVTQIRSSGLHHYGIPAACRIFDLVFDEGGDDRVFGGGNRWGGHDNGPDYLRSVVLEEDQSNHHMKQLRMKQGLRRWTVVLGVLMLPVTSQACAVCFSGAASEELVTALNAAILLMLGVLVVVLGGVIAFFVHLGRKAATPMPDHLVLMESLKQPMERKK